MSQDGPRRRHRRRSPIAFRLTALYLLLGGLWVLLSDRLLERLVTDPGTLTRLQTWKGWLFVAATGLLLYSLTRHWTLTLLRDEERLRRLAYYDPLTGLPNQELFHRRLSLALDEARRRQREVEVIYLDLDRFRTIVRTLGHTAGQRLLRQVARRLKQSLEPGEVLAHVGGDEFALFTAEIVPGTAEGAATRLLKALRQPFSFLGHELHLGASLGIALFPHDGEDGETLLKNAAAAMSRTKEMGGGHFQFYFPDLSRYSLSSLILENRMRRALEQNEFVLLYQPQQDLASGSIVGAEALVSWKHPEAPAVPPEDFIPLAEETGLIEPMGEWVLRTACAQNRRWQEADLPPVRVAVNLSARQFYRRDIAELVRQVLAETGLEGEWLELEITESVLLQDVEETVATLRRLKELGVRIAIDDFGTGYSSLSYLKYLPVDTLKLDRSFIAGIPEDEGDMAIAAAVIAMARTLGLEVVAEGVERDEQRVFLAGKGCHQIQGFLLSPPLAADRMAGLLGSPSP